VYDKYFSIVGFFSFLILGSPFLPTLSGEEGRSGPIDVYLLIDGSSALEERTVAENWVCSTVVDGDTAGRRSYYGSDGGQKPQPLLTLQLGKGQDTATKDKENVEKRDPFHYPDHRRIELRSGPPTGIGTGGPTARSPPHRLCPSYFWGGRNWKQNADRLTMEEANSAEFREFLRYSKTEDFPGWKAIVVGFGMGPRVREAAAEYMAATVGKH